MSQTRVRNLSFLLFLFLIQGCSNSFEQNGRGNPKSIEILPLKIILRGVLPEIGETVGSSIPEVRLFLQKDSVKIEVGAGEFYYMPYNETRFEEILKNFSIANFKNNENFYNPDLGYGGIMRVSKIIKDEVYTRKFSNYTRTDIPITYYSLDSIERVRFAELSDHANELVISVLEDRVKDGVFLTAYSMKEALENPKKVYELNLRNTRAKILSSDIARLSNLRTLDISGSRITKIPDEIEDCIYLRCIKANASRLNEIPKTIGNLKRLRSINFGYCRIRQVPEEIGNLKNLWSINISDNQISELPESISNLKSVTFFSAAENRFNDFPKCLVGLQNVHNLWLHDNNFKEIPKEISQLKNLERFLLDATDIENLDSIQVSMPWTRIVDYGKRK